MQLIVVDSSRGDLFFKYLDTVNCLNLNCLFKRSLNLDLVRRELQPIKNLDSINLCNLASLCYKLHYDYDSVDCINIVTNIVQVIRELNPHIEITQLEVLNYDEEDLKPISRLYLVDEEKDIVYMNRVLRDSLRLLGYIDSQILQLPLKIKNLLSYLPKDICSYMCDDNQTYEKIRKIIQ